MVTIDLNGQSVRANQSKIRKHPDDWHDGVIPGLHGQDGVEIVPSDSIEPESSAIGTPCQGNRVK